MLRECMDYFLCLLLLCFFFFLSFPLFFFLLFRPFFFLLRLHFQRTQNINVKNQRGQIYFCEQSIVNTKCIIYLSSSESLLLESLSESLPEDEEEEYSLSLQRQKRSVARVTLKLYRLDWTGDQYLLESEALSLESCLEDFFFFFDLFSSASLDEGVSSSCSLSFFPPSEPIFQPKTLYVGACICIGSCGRFLGLCKASGKGK